MVAVGLMLMAGCGREPAQEGRPSSDGAPGNVLARVGKRVIRVEDMSAEARRRAALGRPVGSAEELLSDMIMRASLLEQAERRNLQSDAAVQRKMEAVLIGALRDRELEPRLATIEVTDTDVRAEYERRQEEYTRPAQVRLAGLRLPLNPGASEPKRRETAARLAEARRHVIENPPPGGRGPAAQGFGPLAVRYSEDQASRYRGGDLGWLKVGAVLSNWPQAVLETGFNLEKGAVSDVIETRDGVYLVMKTDARPATVTPFEDVRGILRQSLLVQKRKLVQKRYFDEVLESIEHNVHSNRLAEVVLPAEATNASQSEREAAEFPRLRGDTDEE